MESMPTEVRELQLFVELRVAEPPLVVFFEDLDNRSVLHTACAESELMSPADPSLQPLRPQFVGVRGTPGTRNLLFVLQRVEN